MKKLKVSIGGFRFTIGRDKTDVEKAVLPTIIFMNTNHKEFGEARCKGFLLSIGWWDFSICFGILF